MKKRKKKALPEVGRQVRAKGNGINAAGYLG
jgi:hypothetical protein